MKYEAAFTHEASTTALDHLLQHYSRGTRQEDLCFGLWRSSTGQRRLTALIYQIILPEPGERSLHGNASFNPEYLGRAVAEACKQQAGLAFMHSHPSHGWQPLSKADRRAERDAIAYPAGATQLPLVGLTVGNDGTWSARFWPLTDNGIRLEWCGKVRTLTPKSYWLSFNDEALPPQPKREILKRTYDSWGKKNQDTLSRIRVGIIGLGSVGCIVAEAMARIGVGSVTLIDPDTVEPHNLDRLLYATLQDIGTLKVELAETKMREDSTAAEIDIVSTPASIHQAEAYKQALDCDVLFSCVDRPVPRDVLNYIAHCHLIPVFDCGIEVIPNQSQDGLFAAHWRCHIITPYHQCLRCNGQYNTSQVQMELDGSLGNPTYVRNLPPESRPRNQNVFPFSLAVAGMTVNQMLRYVIAPDWWPGAPQEHYQYITGQVGITDGQCYSSCPFPSRKAQGDAVSPPYIRWEPDPSCLVDPHQRIMFGP